MSYMAGTVAVTTGAVAVTGEGTAWLGAVAAGDLLVGPEGRSYPIAAVASNTALTLEVPYRGRSQVGGRYQIMPAVTGTPSVGVAALAAQAEQAAAEAAAAAQGLTNGSANLSAASAVLGGQQVKNMQFDTRAAFIAASPPAWAREWTVKQAGLLLPYLRDDAGVAIQAANGVKGSPAGDSFPEHFAALGDAAVNDQAALVAWAAWGRSMRGRPGAVYLATARAPGGINFPSGASADMGGAIYRQTYTQDDNNSVFILNERSEVKNLGWELMGSAFLQRGIQVYGKARMQGWRIRSEAEMPAPDDVRDGLVILRGAEAIIDDVHIDGAFIGVRVYQDADCARSQIRNLHLSRYAIGISIRGGFAGGVIDGVYIHSVSSLASTVPGHNVVNEGAANAIVRNVHQLCEGKGSGEHFIYSSVADGTPGMRFESIYSRGSGQCFMKFRGHDGATLADCHGGPTSISNTPGTNEDGFRFEHCRNIRAKGISVARQDSLANPAGYDGIHLNNCWNMDFSGVSLDQPGRAYLYLCTPAPLSAYTAPPAGGITGITINGLTAVGAGSKPLILAGPSDSGAETTVTIGNITITDLVWDGDVANLFQVAPGVTLTQLAGTAIRISGVARGVPFEYVRAAGAAPVYASLVAQPADPAAGRAGAGTVNLPNCADLNDSTLANGFYRTVGGVLNWAGLPQEWGCLQVIRNPNRITQIWYNDNPASFGGTVFRRMWDGASASWTPWYRMLDGRSAVGTITLSSDGQPTGPIIQRGSFANGEYVRWADGFQVCTLNAHAGGPVNVTAGALFRSNTLTWTYPVDFVNVPVVLPTANDITTWVAHANPGLTSCDFRLLSYQSIATAVTAGLVAIGRYR